MTNLERALSLRFTDSSEIRDVANHGCQGGVSDFIYSSELFEFFNEHESDIEDILEQLDVPLTQLVKDPEYWTMQELRESAVWIVVEYYCQGIVDAYAVAVWLLPTSHHPQQQWKPQRFELLQAMATYVAIQSMLLLSYSVSWAGLKHSCQTL